MKNLDHTNVVKLIKVNNFKIIIINFFVFVREYLQKKTIL